MHTPTRNGNRWTVNELLTLQREYELLEWSIQQIAESHQRTVRAVLFKLELEGFITSWNDARGFDSSPLSSSATWKDTDSCNEEDENEECCDDNKDEDYVDDGDEEDDDDEDDYEDDNSEVTKLSERVWSLETSVNDIGNMVKQLFNSMLQKKSKTPKKLRVSSTH
jgi:hypothetical protein